MLYRTLLNRWFHGSQDLSLAALRISELETAGDVDGLISAMIEGVGIGRREQARAWIVDALKRLNDPRAEEPLVFVSRHDPNAEVRMAAVQALEVVGTADNLATPLSQALGDGSRLVRMAAAEAIGSLGVRDATQPLGRVFEADPDDWTRLCAGEALASLGQPPSRTAISRAARPPMWAVARRSRWRRLREAADRAAPAGP